MPFQMDLPETSVVPVGLQVGTVGTLLQWRPERVAEKTSHQISASAARVRTAQGIQHAIA